jgi:Uma2 family endonuclease
MSPARVITDEELLQLPKDGNRYEVVDGELVVSPGAGLRHERVIMRLTALLLPFVNERRLGELLPSNLLYKLPSGNRRGPDLSFIRSEHATALHPDTVFPQLAPDLAVEVVSPSDSLPRVLAKVAEYLACGVRLVWVIDPENRRAAVGRALTGIREIGPDGEFDGEDVLPGFRCHLSDLVD